MKKYSNNLIFLGTSHMCDMNGLDNNLNDYASEITDTWPYNVSESLKFKHVNLSIPSAGLDTYFLRISNLISNYDPSIIVLEIPSLYRLSIFPQSNNYTAGDAFKENYWNYTAVLPSTDETHYSNNFIMITNANPTDKGIIRRINRLNTIVETEITRHHIKSLYSSHIMSNHKILIDDHLSKIVSIDALLKNNNFFPIWINFNFSSEYNQLLDNIQYFNNIINNASIVDYLSSTFSINKPDAKYYPDGSHLTTTEWKKYIVPLIISYIKDLDR